MRVLLGMPCIKSIPTSTVISLLRTAERGKVDAMIVEGSLVYDARNEIARAAVNEGYDYVLYADSDMIFSNEDLNRLLQHNVGICSGLYITRRGDNKNVAYKKIITRTLFRDPELIHDESKTGFGEVSAVGFGFCLIKTTVLKTMFKYYKNLFDPKWGVGEDIAFCIRAKRLGYKTFIDRDVQLGHIGNTVYTP